MHYHFDEDDRDGEQRYGGYAYPQYEALAALARDLILRSAPPPKQEIPSESGKQKQIERHV
jgi:hypothetical protein